MDFVSNGVLVHTTNYRKYFAKTYRVKRRKSLTEYEVVTGGENSSPVTVLKDVEARTLTTHGPNTRETDIGILRNRQTSNCLALNSCLDHVKSDHIRLWTIQSPDVWNALQEQKTLLVDPNHPTFVSHIDGFPDAYDWMREQMTQRISDYSGHYPWWAYEHFLDLRFYRWHTHPSGQRLVRLELVIPREKVLLSAYGDWHCVLNRAYLPASILEEDYDREMAAWEEAAKRSGIEVSYGRPKVVVPYPEPWEMQMQTSWEHVFDVEARRPTQTIQATFEELKLAEVVKATEFASMP